MGEEEHRNQKGVSNYANSQPGIEPVRTELSIVFMLRRSWCASYNNN
jgi:hypothetical protein